LQPRGFSQHGGASRNSRAWLHLIWTTVLLPPLDFQKVRATPDFKKFNLKGRVVVWLFRAECAAANAPIAEATLREIPKAARGLGLQISVLNASTPREIEAAFATLVRDRADALFVMPDALFISRRVQFAARHGIPTAYSVREDVEASGLMSYGTDVLDMYRQVGVYAGQILKGAKAEARVQMKRIFSCTHSRALVGR
jgi:hypothetical protein